MKSLLFYSLLIFGILLNVACSNDDGEDENNCITYKWYLDNDGDGLGNPNISADACDQPTGYVLDNTDTDDSSNVNDTTITDTSTFDGKVDPSLFLTSNGNVVITTVPCTLSDGTVTECFEILATATPDDHDMGPWCPRNISDGADKGGIWLENGEVYDVDGAFIENMATFYSDNTWKMYDANGDIYVTDTQQDCENAANPNVGTAYQNYCVECLPSYVSNLTQTYLIPITPVKQAQPYSFTGGGPMGGISVRGLAFNGVRFEAPAPTDAILGAYTLAPFDDAGGHINVFAGYHYHAATGQYTKIKQADGHAAMIGYALDGHGIYELLDEDGNEPTDLDQCRGHYDEIRGYHYHVAPPGTNSFIDCLYGAYAN